MMEGNYFARAWIRSMNGNGDPHGDAQVRFTWDERPERVIDLFAPVISARSITVTWERGPDDRIKSFDFFINESYVGHSPNKDLTSYTFGGLSPSTQYVLGVTAVADTERFDFTNQHYSPRARVTLSTGPPLPPSPSPQLGSIIWEEHFETLDLSRWKLEHSTYGDGNNERQCYRPRNVGVQDGKLVLAAVRETYTCPNGSTRTVTSGMVRSVGLNIGPGQMLEFRVKLTPADENNQEGIWPAVWASGWGGGGWPLGGEIDFLEVMTAINPRRSIYSIHFLNSNDRHAKIGRETFEDEFFSRNWHTIQFWYGFGTLVWYLDGVEIHRLTYAPTKQGWPAPFDQSTRELKLNLALGGRPGPLNDAALGEKGAIFEVDFIRAYEISGDF